MQKIQGSTLFGAAFCAALALFSCATSHKGEAKPDSITSASTVDAAQASILSDIPAVADGKKTLVVFFSTGNASELVASDLAAIYGADIERIVEMKTRKGSSAFMTAGADSSMGKATAIVAPSFDPASYDRVFVLTPIWAWKLSPPVRSWLRLFKGKLPPVAFGTISGDTKPDKVVSQMAKEGGREPFAFAGFSEKDFKAEGRAHYLEKLKKLAGLAE